MRIGIDARFLTHPQVGGFKTYTENLINALGEIDQENRYIIFLDRPPVQDTFLERDNFTFQVVKGTIPLLGMPFREQVRLRHHIKRARLDIVHFLCNTAPIGISDSFVVTLHDTIQVSIPTDFKLALGRSNLKHLGITAYSKWAILKTAKAARKIITVSNYEKTQITKLLEIPPERVCVTHLAPNPLFTSVSAKAKGTLRTKLRQRLGLRHKFILGIGWEPRKNTPLLIESFARLAPDYPDLELVIVAAEEESRNYFRQLAEELRLSTHIRVLKSCPPEELAELYSQAEVFVFPSERESFGLPPVEAMACGVPTIAMNTTSIPEVVQDGAMLVDGRDVQTWANAMKKVIADESLRAGLIERGRLRAFDLTWQRCAVKTVEVYRMVKAMKSRCSPNPAVPIERKRKSANIP